MLIVGLRTEKYIDTEVSGHNCNFVYTKAEFTKHILCGVNDDGSKVEITLHRTEGECGSGWTTASFGHITVTNVSKFNGFTHVPVKMLEIPDFNVESDEIDNEIFSMSSYGGDNYYPSGYYSVNMDLFIECPGRVKEKRPVWIFQGNSGTGKSFLASRLNSMNIYETDTSETLPEIIDASVVVLGNKYQFSIEDVKSKLFGDVEVTVVTFE